MDNMAMRVSNNCLRIFSESDLPQFNRENTICVKILKIIRNKAIEKY